MITAILETTFVVVFVITLIVLACLAFSKEDLMNANVKFEAVDPDREPCSRVFVRDYGHLVKAEYRIGPEVTCEAVAIKCPDGWVIDGIETLPTWRRHGHARAILERIVEISGMPVLAVEIEPGAEEFWAHMTDLGINLANA